MVAVEQLVMDEIKKPIKSFHDRGVYQVSYNAMLVAFKDILPKLPKEEEYDLKDQLHRSAKAIPSLIALKDALKDTK